MSVANRCRRGLLSPTPCVALVLEEDGELDWVESSLGLCGEGTGVSGAPVQLSVTEELVSSLADRLDGVALLAEAVSHDHAVGKYHEFVRLFERAFLLPVTQLEKILSRFLAGSGLGYGREEVRQWIALRHPSTHADMRVTGGLVFDTDVQRFVPRMLQASYDVLMNKATWSDRSIDRRDTWKPTSGSNSAGADFFIKSGHDVVLEFQLFDEFGVYGRDFAAFFQSWPPGLWSKWAKDQPAEPTQ